MSEQTGPSLAAIQARQSAMASQHDSVAEADRALMEVLASAHAATRESIRRLDAIADEIERAVPQHNSPALDTSMGAREFQKFLVAKQREIAAVVADARALDRAKTAVLESLRGEYGVSAD
ncbi:hypothetical protein AWC05_20925 [Mycobacterium florentinum]|uniref:DUF4226 domain-containing protein n=1 Tax=Mycobacterium florentinum TaxID=292462 RepID=A0A1X1U5C7_MYCFL|nr:DUF4226 domain-containing protein [Mycobacterium florentinum]MCV7410400.1 DUF4226 domain-containing protein [Mycobacterium florentinum]ORV52016.1 hypothetical protein AWC05_20925 [Mycobacterium florentinum]BBX79718.1 hypothetical protein MFLOJ_35050 [Mycobacterium florentinum]